MVFESLERHGADVAVVAALAALGPDVGAEASYIDENGTRNQYWIVTSIGILWVTAERVGGADRATADLTPWSEVREPELRLEVLTSQHGSPTRTWTFGLQSPRFHATASSERLLAFARAVIAHAQR